MKRKFYTKLSEDVDLLGDKIAESIKEGQALHVAFRLGVIAGMAYIGEQCAAEDGYTPIERNLDKVAKTSEHKFEELYKTAKELKASLKDKLNDVG